MELHDLLGIASRWVHIVSAITVLGSVIFVRCGLAGQTALFAGFHRAILYALAGLFASGLYNFLTKMNTSPAYHIAFAVKLLLALHVAAVTLLAARPDVAEPKRSRQLGGVMASGFLIVLVSGYMRWLSR